MSELWTIDSMREYVDNVSAAYDLMRHEKGSAICVRFDTFNEAWNHAIELGYKPMRVTAGVGFEKPGSPDVAFIDKVFA